MLHFEDELSPVYHPHQKLQAESVIASDSILLVRDVAVAPTHAMAESPLANKRRVNVAHERVINDATGVNQLVPFKYKCAWEKHLTSCVNDWMSQEVNMACDNALRRDSDGLSDDERLLVKRKPGIFVKADSLAANNNVLGSYRHVTAPAYRQFFLRQAFVEAIHTHAYQYIVESLGLDEGEIYNAYYEVPVIRAKDEFLIPFIDTLTNPEFRTGTHEADRQLLRSLIVFACVVEGSFFYVGFVQILALGRQNKMTGAAEHRQYILRDESMHCNFGIDLINTIKMENAQLWTLAVCEEIRELMRMGMEQEYRYAEDTMSCGCSASMRACSRNTCASTPIAVVGGSEWLRSTPERKIRFCG